MVVVVPICAAQETAGWETLPLLCDGGTGSGHSEHLATVTQLPAPALTRDTRVVKLRVTGLPLLHCRFLIIILGSNLSLKKFWRMSCDLGMIHTTYAAQAMFWSAVAGGAM